MTKRTLHSIAAVAIIIFSLSVPTSLSAQTDYVFMYNNYIFGQSTSVSTDFIPNNCIYTGSSGSTFQNGNGLEVILR